MSVRRRIGWAVAALFGPLLVAFAALPYLVDVESYKPSLIEAVKAATGRELVIDGPMKLSVFPVPRISAQQVHFANAAGATGAQMVDVRWIGASPSWLALLQGTGRGRTGDALPAHHRARDRRQRRAQLAVPARRRRCPAGRRARRRLPSRGRRAPHRAGHDQLHQSAERPDVQGRGRRRDGIGRLAGRPVLDLGQRHRERRAAVARLQPGRGRGRTAMRPSSA